MSNETNDLDGPPSVRKLIYDRLSERGFILLPIAEVDQRLKDNGFTDGGQLRAAKVEDLGKWLDSDALLYLTLLDFNYINVGFYWHRKVKVSGRIVQASGGDRLWEADRMWMTVDVATNKDDAKRKFAEQLAIQALEKMMHTPLRFEAARAVDLLIKTIPTTRCESKGEKDVH